MAVSIKCFSCKNKDSGSSPQHPQKTWMWCLTSSAGEMERKVSLGACWLASLDRLVSPALSERPCLIK